MLQGHKHRSSLALPVQKLSFATNQVLNFFWSSMHGTKGALVDETLTMIQSTLQPSGSSSGWRVLLKEKHGKLLNWDGRRTMACGLVTGDTCNLQHAEQRPVASSP